MSIAELAADIELLLINSRMSQLLAIKFVINVSQ